MLDPEFVWMFENLQDLLFSFLWKTMENRYPGVSGHKIFHAIFPLVYYSTIRNIPLRYITDKPRVTSYLVKAIPLCFNADKTFHIHNRSFLCSTKHHFLPHTFFLLVGQM